MRFGCILPRDRRKQVLLIKAIYRDKRKMNLQHGFTRGCSAAELCSSTLGTWSKLVDLRLHVQTRNIPTKTKRV